MWCCTFYTQMFVLGKIEFADNIWQNWQQINIQTFRTYIRPKTSSESRSSWQTSCGLWCFFLVMFSSYKSFVLRIHDPKLLSCLHLNIKFQKEIGQNHLNSLPNVLFICCYIGSVVVFTCCDCPIIPTIVLIWPCGICWGWPSYNYL